MSVKNGDKFVGRAIESMLEQTFRKFEFLIVDDGSSDQTWETIRRYSRADSRIKAIKNSNIGLTRSLNFLIEQSRGNFIARIDADDTSKPKRLELQLEFMEKNGFFMSSSCYRVIDKYDKELYVHCPSSEASCLKWSLIFRNNIRHSTVMWRSSNKYLYNESFEQAQDYELWCRMAQNEQIGTIKEIMSDIMIHDESISKNSKLKQENLSIEITKKQAEYYLSRELSREEAANLRLLYFLKDKDQFDMFASIEKENLRRSILLYLELLSKFSAREPLIFEEMIQDISYDINSLIINENTKNSFVEAIYEWFKKNDPTNLFMMLVKEKFLKTTSNTNIKKNNT